MSLNNSTVDSKPIITRDDIENGTVAKKANEMFVVYSARDSAIMLSADVMVMKDAVTTFVYIDHSKAVVVPEGGKFTPDPAKISKGELVAKQLVANNIYTQKSALFNDATFVTKDVLGLIYQIKTTLDGLIFSRTINRKLDPSSDLKFKTAYEVAQANHNVITGELSYENLLRISSMVESNRGGFKCFVIPSKAKADIKLAETKSGVRLTAIHLGNNTYSYDGMEMVQSLSEETKDIYAIAEGALKLGFLDRDFEYGTIVDGFSGNIVSYVRAWFGFTITNPKGVAVLNYADYAAPGAGGGSEGGGGSAGGGGGQ